MEMAAVAVKTLRLRFAKMLAHEEMSLANSGGTISGIMSMGCVSAGECPDRGAKERSDKSILSGRICRIKSMIWQ
jgi:hypothetical protein